MFHAAKDAVSSKAAQAYLNKLIARYGEVEALKIDSRARSVDLTLRLQGEPSLITARIGHYAVHNTGETYAVEVSDCTCSRAWVETLVQDFVTGRRFALPAWAAAAL